MLDRERAREILAALRQREQREAKQRQVSDLCDALRRFYYPKQRGFLRSTARWRATRKTRRMGATSGGCREFTACALEQPGFRATYATTTRQEAIDRAWRNDNATGFIDLLEEFGEPIKHPSLTAYNMGGVTVEVRESDLKLEFSNGSQIELFGAENLRAHKRKRGNAKHKFWIDEAQDFPDLESFFDSVVIGSITDFNGEAWLTGTPGRDCVGMFYDVTKEPEEGEMPIEGWEVHEIAVTDNPYFGRVEWRPDGLWIVGREGIDPDVGPHDNAEEAEQAAKQLRWDRTAGEAKRLKGWNGTEPDFVREWLGRWVKEDARFVFPVHSVPKHKLIYAPQRLMPNPFVGSHPRFDGHPAWYDHHAAVRDLPRRRPRDYQWLFSLGADFGYNPDPFALVLWAFTPDLPEVFEMFSWKQIKVHTDDQGAYMRLLFDVIENCVSFVGDPAGKRDDFGMWRGRMNLPIEEANKQGKNTLEEFLADDIRRERVHLRDGSPLYTEMRHLVYLPQKPGKQREVFKHRKVNGVVHGDHCCDASRYSYADLTHYLAKLPTDKPKPGTREALMLEEQQLERKLDDIERRREARYDEMESQDENAAYHAASGDWQWQ